MKESIYKKYYYYVVAVLSYFLLAIKNYYKSNTNMVHYLVKPKTFRDMYKRYGFINLLRAAKRAPRNLNFSTTGITLFRNVYLPDMKKTALSTSLEVTNNCPHRCKGCYIDIRDKKSDYFMPEQLLRDTVESLQYSEFIIIQGGEPCSKKYMTTLYNVIKDFPRQSFIICTGGMYIGKYGLGNLKKLNNILWAISINGTEEINDKLRFKGSFKYAIKAMNNIRDAQQYFVAVTTVSKINIESATSEEFVMTMAKLGVKEIKYLILRNPESGQQLTKNEIEYWSSYTTKFNKYIFTTFSVDEIEGYSVVNPYGQKRYDRTGNDNSII